MNSDLQARVQCPVFLPGADGYASETIGYNLAAVCMPEVVVAAETVDDVAAAVAYAREHHLPVHVQNTGHGADRPVKGGMLISTRRLNRVQVDPATCTAIIGAGAHWRDVVKQTAPHGLAPVTGSSSDVGAVGFLLGGGLGPLARSHGFGSDYIERATVVTGAGEVVQASATEHPDLFWALRGGKGGFGVVTGVQLRLIELRELYAGSLFFAEPDIEQAFRAWVDWLPTCDARVTTSAAVMNMPPLEMIPPPLRGRRLLSLRFAYPGDLAQGTALAAPLRAFAPVYLDMLGPLPANEMDKIHNDPKDPLPVWGSGTLLSRIDQEFADKFLGFFGAGAHSPFLIAEVRNIGGAAAHDVAGGSAAAGRTANFTLVLIGAPDPTLFATVLPAAGGQIMETLRPWFAPENNPNFLGVPCTPDALTRVWLPETRARLNQVRSRYDPDGIFTFDLH